MMAKCKLLSKPDAKEARIKQKLFPIRNYDVAASEAVVAYAKGKSYFIRTYGCQANIRDEEVISGILQKVGFVRAKREADAAFIILNTCAVRENAEDKVFGELGKLKSVKAEDKSKIIAVSGCMSQQSHVVDTLIQKYPHVDIILGTHNLDQILELLDICLRTKNRVVDVRSRPLEIVEKLPSVRNSPYKAFVNISYGCDKFCTYCIVPYTRGQERSRPEVEILGECQQLIRDGYQEITLLGQNVNSYGKDLASGLTFAKLLSEVAELGIPRLRFLTSHPFDFTDDIIAVMARHENIMKYIHLPLQSGSNSILRAMGRRYSREEYLNLIARIRAGIPTVALSTDIIVGFPEESEEQFADTIDLVERICYESAFTFIYSPREGTPAAQLVDNVTKEEKSKRFIALSEVLEKSVARSAEAMVGRTYRVLVDGWSKRDKSVLSGYTESNKLVHFKGAADIIGRIVDVRVTESHTYSLMGELVDG